MIWGWISQVALDPTPIANNLIAQYAALGVLIIGMAVIIVVQYREIKALRTKNDDLNEKRLAEAMDGAKSTLEPFKELTNFVRTLYDGDRGRGKS